MKPVEDFYSQEKINSKGEKYTYFRPDCKDCTSNSAMRWQENNKEKYMQNVKNQNRKRKDVIRVSGERRRLEGKVKKWRQNNPDKIKEYNKKHELHKKHDISENEWTSCKNYFNNPCAYCGISEKEAKVTQGHYLHMEHAINNGSNDITNCVPSCRNCNSSKRTNDYTKWYTEELSQFSIERLMRINSWLNVESFKIKEHKVTI